MQLNQCIFFFNRAIKIDETQAKKLKAEPKDEVDLAAENALEETIKKQTKQLFKIRDFLHKLCTKTDLQNILFANNSTMVEGNDNLLDRCADFLTFGALVKCQKCKKGDFIFSKHGYRCKGMIDEWSECGNFEEKPLRRKCQIPSAMKSDGDSFFSKYKSKVEDRAVRPGVPTAVKKEEEAREARVSRKREPLYNMHVVAIGNSSMPKEDMKRAIERMGGKLVTKIQEHTAVVISNAEEVEKMNKRMLEVQSCNIQVVPEDFLTAIKDGNPTETIEKIKSMNLCSWGSDPLARIPGEEIKGPKESIYSRNVSKTANIKLKNGTAIDPDSGLHDVAHVYRQDGTLYTSTLSFTDIQKNKNSYYKLQVLESDAGRKYWLFRAWGRIGTKVGDHKLESYPSAELACSQFETLFEEKTGNMFNAGISFKKVAGKYYPIEVDYNDDDKAKKNLEKSGIKSKMPKPTQELIEMLFDVNQMKQTMMEFELDLDKMPLGRLSKKQLHDAYQVLTDLNNLVVRGALNNEFIGLSNKFFTLVPHSFGMNKAPVIDTLEMIQNKREILDNLIEVEIAYSMLQQDTDDKMNPLDAHYEQLKTELLPLDHKSDEFSLIDRYVQNTHAATHNTYSLEVLDVFKVNRAGEKRRYKPFKKLHNRQLLWHGSRMTNFVGILSHGLKIAPPEAPVTGYMFGKGIYFADMVSKSANYCCTTPQNNVGMMLLSEVALGDMHELKKAKYVEKLPAGKHSVKGVGKTSPDEKEAYIRDDGVVIPLGKSVTDNKLSSDLLYNEYIVYDVAQANVQYLLKLKFNYNKRTR